MIRLVCVCVALVIFTWPALGVGQQSTHVNGDVAIELSGFSLSETYDLKAGDPLELSDSQFRKLLFRCPKVSAGNFEKWSKFAEEVSWPQLVDSPPQFRFWAFSRKLTLNRLTHVALGPSLATDDLKGFYLASCVSESGQEALLISRTAPAKMTLDESIAQPISFSGFYYNAVAVDDEGELQIVERRAADDESEEDAGAEGAESKVVPVFIVGRFAWHPDATNEAMGVSQGLLDLATHGVDVSLFDFVLRNNSKPLSSADSDAFYQTLGAVYAMNQAGGGVAAEADPMATAADQKAADQKSADQKSVIGFIDIMSAPKSHLGDAIAITGSLRQCVSVEIVDPDRRAQVGLDRYYQVSLFPDLKGRDVAVRGNGEEVVKLKRFPVTVCFPELPAGFTAADLEGKMAGAEGYFYRFIRYESQVSDAAGLSGQVSPLVMANRLEVRTPAVTAAGVDFFLRFLLVGILALVGGVFVYGWFKDRRRRRRLAEDAEPLPERIDVAAFEDQVDV